MKEIKVFLKRYAAILLMLTVVLTVSVGTLWAKYTTDVTVTGELSLEVKAEEYVINRDSLRQNLRTLGQYYQPTTLKFVTGTEAMNHYWAGTAKCTDGEKWITFNWDAKTRTMYIGPYDANDSTSVVCAPEDSSNLLCIKSTVNLSLFAQNLTTIDCSNLSTSKVTNMNNMFSGLTKLTDLTLGPRFDTSKVTNMSKMFENCSSLSTITVTNSFNADNVVDSTDMFNGCTSLVGGSGTEYDGTKIDNTYAKIDGGTESPGYFTGVENGLMGLSLNLAFDSPTIAEEPVLDGDTVDPVDNVSDVTTAEPVVTEESDVTETVLSSDGDVSTDTSEPTEELPQVTGQTEETDTLDEGNS